MLHTPLLQPEFAGAGAPRDRRTVTTLLAGRLFRANGSDELCQVRNISSRGMMVDTPSTFEPGERVLIELRSSERLDGTIAWISPGRVGIQFDTAIAPEEILARNAPKGARAPRFTVQCTALIACNGKQSTVTVENLSQSGARVLLANPESLSGQFTVAVAGLASRHATLRWRSDFSAGIAFLEMVPYSEFAQWLSTQRRN